jgi:uncharacterized protein DUF1579
MRKASTISLFTLVTLVLAAVAVAQNPPAPPKPGPEIEKLKYFVGNWKEEGTLAARPEGPAGKFTATYHNAMLPGGFYVELHATEDVTGEGKFTSTAYLGYNADQKVYTYDEFSSSGEHTVAKGTLEGDTWTWTNESKMGGQTMNGRYTEKMTSPTSYDFKFEASMDGGKTYSTYLEGKATKVGAAAAAKPASSSAKASASAAKPAKK